MKLTVYVSIYERKVPLPSPYPSNLLDKPLLTLSPYTPISFYVIYQKRL
jgi:hypothetical protein